MTAKLFAAGLIFILLLSTEMAPALAFAAETGSGSALRLPYSITKRKHVSASRDVFYCPAPPASALRDLVFKSVYKKSDPHRASVDKKAQKKYIEETAALKEFETSLIEMSNGYMRTGSRQRAQCVLKWLHSWAKEDALLGETNNVGIAVRQWSLAALGSAYAQIRDASIPDMEDENRVVRSWLLRCAEAVMTDYPEDSGERHKENNHLYWAAWAVTITGIALDDRPLYAWGIDRAKTVLAEQFWGDGTLPLEMGRGKKALHYHIFAVLPLVMLAEAGRQNGDDLYGIRDGVLHRLVRRILTGLKDPSYFQKKARAKQIPADDLHQGHFAWMEPYNRWFPHPDLQEKLKELRPIFSRRTGGDMTFLYR